MLLFAFPLPIFPLKLLLAFPQAFEFKALSFIGRHSTQKSHLRLPSDRIRIAEQFEALASDMLAAERQQQLEGVIAIIVGIVRIYSRPASQVGTI